MANAFEFANGHSDESGSGFLLGLLTGAVLGAGLGLLLAPKSGSELRDQLADQAGALANTASDGYRRASGSVSEWADRGKRMYDKARESVSDNVADAKKFAQEGATAATTWADAAKGGHEAE